MPSCRFTLNPARVCGHARRHVYVDVPWAFAMSRSQYLLGGVNFLGHVFRHGFGHVFRHVLGHMLSHVPANVLRHVLEHVLRRVLRHVLKQVFRHVRT